MARNTKFKRKTSKMLNQRRLRRSTMKGGSIVTFNSPMNFQDIPKTDYYPLNTYANDISVSPNLIDSRQQGGKRKRHRKINRTQKKIKGGSTFLITDPILGNTANNSLLSMNQIPGYSGAINISNMLSNGGSTGPSLSYAYVNNSMV